MWSKILSLSKLLRLVGLISRENIKKSLKYVKYYGIMITIKKVIEKLHPENAIFEGEIRTLYVPLIDVKEAEIIPADDSFISVVIPTKNAGEGFEYLLKMVINQKGVNDTEVVIVDSGSNDRTLEIAGKYEAKIIEIPPEEFSHSYSRNLGATNASGRYLFFTVQDALIPSDSFFYELLSTLKNNKVAAVSCAEFPRSDADLFYRVLSRNHYDFIGVNRHDRILSLPAQENYMTLRQNGQLSDIACLISRDIFTKYKYRFNYAEDLDLGIRLIKDGLNLGFLGSARMIHSHNRPPYYYLKRGYVDNVFLTNIFPDYPVPEIGIERITADILATFHAVNLLIDGDLKRINLPCRTSDVFNIVKQGLDASYGCHTPQNFDSCTCSIYMGKALESFLMRTYELYCPSSKNADGGIIRSSMLNFLEIVFKYMADTYELIDEYILEDFKFCVCKIYALLSGAHLAYCYTKHPGDKKELKDLHYELTKGV